MAKLVALAAPCDFVYRPGPMKNKPVVCTSLHIEIMGPKDASTKRIRFVEDILRDCISTLDKDFRNGKIPQTKGFSLKSEPISRNRSIVD
jgi:hypothetical protein